MGKGKETQQNMSMNRGIKVEQGLLREKPDSVVVSVWVNRKRPKGKCAVEYYQAKAEQLQLLEYRNESGEIDLYYADETQISEQGYVPYGWQFKILPLHHQKRRTSIVSGYCQEIKVCLITGKAEEYFF